MSEPSEYAGSATFHANRAECVQLCDLSGLLNSLMFSCAAVPGLAKVLTNMLDFEAVAMRARDACELRGGPKGEVRRARRRAPRRSRAQS